MAKPQTDPANDQARGHWPLPRLHARHRMVILQSGVHARGVHLRLQRDFPGSLGGGTENKSEFAMLIFAGMIQLGNRAPDWIGLGLYLFVGAFIAWAGLFWFQKTRKGFADVL